MTSFDATKSSLDEKISLNVNARLVNPACRAGTDVSHSMGLPDQIQHPTVKAAIQKVIDVVAKSNVGNAAAAREWRARRAHYIVTTIESVMASAVRD